MDPYIGEIRLFAGSFVPAGWALCDGTEHSVQWNQALYTIVGNIYGGDGRTTFQLPDLRNCVPVHFGQGLGLSPYVMGQTGGESTVTLTEDQLPNHDHDVACSNLGNQTSPVGAVWGGLPGKKAVQVYNNADADTPMNPQAISSVGSDQAHNNLQPFLTLNFIIALEGVYPVKPS